MGKTTLEGANSSSSSRKTEENTLAAPLLAAGVSAPSAAASTAAPVTASAAVVPDSHSHVAGTGQEWRSSSSSSRPRTPQQGQTVVETRRKEGRRRNTSFASIAANVESSLMLLPISLTPAIAIDPHVQSIDLYANVKAYDHGQGCCGYLCVRCSPVFDWVRYVHAQAYQRRPSAPPSPESGSTDTAAAPFSSSSSSGGEGGETGEQQQQQLPRGRDLPLFVDVGQAPVGAQASLLTLFGYRQLVFRAVQEVNRAYSNFWRLLLLVLLLLVIFIPGIGLVSLLLLGCCSSLRKICDDAALQQMRAACEKADQRLAAWGVGLLLMEGFPSATGLHTRRDLEMAPSPAGAAASCRSFARSGNIAPAVFAASDANSSAALAAAAAAPSHSSRVWVLRVYMLPRSSDAYTAGAAAAAAAAAAPSVYMSNAAAPLLSSQSSTARPTSAPAPVSGVRSDAADVPSPSLAPAAAAATAFRSEAAASTATAAAEKCCMQRREEDAADRERKEPPCCAGDAGDVEVVPQQQKEDARQLAQQARGIASAVRDATAAIDEKTSHYEKPYAAATDVDTAAVTRAATGTESEESQLLQPRGNARGPVPTLAESKGKGRNRRRDRKQEGMQEPLLCQEESLEQV